MIGWRWYQWLIANVFCDCFVKIYEFQEFDFFTEEKLSTSKTSQIKFSTKKFVCKISVPIVMISRLRLSDRLFFLQIWMKCDRSENDSYKFRDINFHFSSNTQFLDRTWWVITTQSWWFWWFSNTANIRTKMSPFFIVIVFSLLIICTSNASGVFSFLFFACRPVKDQYYVCVIYSNKKVHRRLYLKHKIKQNNFRIQQIRKENRSQEWFSTLFIQIIIIITKCPTIVRDDDNTRLDSVSGIERFFHYE